MAGAASLPRLHLPLPPHWRLACFGTGTDTGTGLIITTTVACFGTCSSTITSIGSGIIIATVACFGTCSSTINSIGSGIIITTVACFGTCSGTATSIGYGTAGRRHGYGYGTAGRRHGYGYGTVVDARAGSGFSMRGARGIGRGMWVGQGWEVDKEGSEGQWGSGVSLRC